MMKTRLILLLLLLVMISGCYGPITGTVIDEETKKPIEGAVVYAEWVVTKGIPGFWHDQTYKVIETETDTHGKFSIEGLYSFNPTVDLQTLIVYKPGYVAWQDKSIFRFPEYSVKRIDFHWQNGYVFRLEKFKKTYSHAEHIDFFSATLLLNASSKLEQAMSWEQPYKKKEEYLFEEKGKITKGKTMREIYKEVAEELYGLDEGSDKGKSLLNQEDAPDQKAVR